MKRSIRKFSPKQTAQLETEMWKAYYAHRFFKLFILIVRLLKMQFKISYAASVTAAAYTAKAAKTFRKTGDTDNTLRQLTKYFTYLEKRSIENYDPKEAAKLELLWWQVHRRPNQYDITLDLALAELMALLYSVSPNELADYGLERAKAMETRQHAAHITKTEPDWPKIQKHLETSYSNLKNTVETQHIRKPKQ